MSKFVKTFKLAFLGGHPPLKEGMFVPTSGIIVKFVNYDQIELKSLGASLYGSKRGSQVYNTISQYASLKRGPCLQFHF